jgi:AcrR family transcriptional regulator
VTHPLERNDRTIGSVNVVNVIDGRTARRNRNRDAVLDAMIALTTETGEEPAIEAVSERAGVSYRSVYRYFDDRTDLMVSAIKHIMGDGYAIFVVDQLGEGSLDIRITRLVDTLVHAHQVLDPLTRLAVRQRADDPAVAEFYDGVRRYNRRQVEKQFAPELDALESHERHLALAAIGAMFQVESLDYLFRHAQLDEASITKILARNIEAQLSSSER